MFQVYNTMLRQPKKGEFQAELYESFKARGNYFSTTIHVLVSATVKLAKTNKIQSGLRLYRGIGRELPEQFYNEDEFGRKGYMEWGFMSTTSNENVAREVNKAISITCLYLLILLIPDSLFAVLWSERRQADRNGIVP